MNVTYAPSIERASGNGRAALRSPQPSPASSLPVSCWVKRFATSLRLKVCFSTERMATRSTLVPVFS